MFKRYPTSKTDPCRSRILKMRLSGVNDGPAEGGAPYNLQIVKEPFPMDLAVASWEV